MPQAKKIWAKKWQTNCARPLPVEAPRDLKGKTVAVQYFRGGDHALLSSMLAYVGIRPDEVKWIVGENARDAMHLFLEGKADAFLAFSQQSEELRQKKIGHLIIDTAVDPPWSQYFCCVVAANREYAPPYPVVTNAPFVRFLRRQMFELTRPRNLVDCSDRGCLKG